LGEEVDIQSWGLDAQFKWCGFSLQAEGYWGQAKGQPSGRGGSRALGRP
jgi:hypothetical protein